MATARVPRARSAASWAWSTGASGVVRDPPSVPITPVGSPEWARMDRTSWVTVVFPLVPVTPTIFIVLEGCPLNADATVAMAGLTAPGATRTWVTSRSRNRSHNSEVAPPVTAWAAWTVAVGVLAGDTAEQRPRAHQPAVEVHRRHLGGSRIAADIEHIDVMDQLGHQHERVFQVVGRDGGLLRSGSGPT